VSKIHKIDVINSSLSTKYELTVENSKGEEVKVVAVQSKDDKSIDVVSIKSTAETSTVKI